MDSPPARRRRRRRVRLGMLLALASSASAVSLNDLQPVQDGVLPLACSLVYHAAIQGCTTADFTNGQSCSLSCIAGIKQTEETVAGQCQDVNAKTTSLELLSDAQRGSLILQLCVGNDFTLATTTSTSSIRPPLTTPLLTTSRTIGTFSIIPFPTTTTPIQTTTAQTIPIQTTATETTFTFVPPSISSTPLVTTSQLSTTGIESVVTQSSTFMTTALTSTSRTTAETSASTSASQTGDGRGGGSPFDTTSGSSKLSMPWSLCLAIGALLANLRLR